MERILVASKSIFSPSPIVLVFFVFPLFLSDALLAQRFDPEGIDFFFFPLNGWVMRHFRRPETFEANSIPVFLLLAIEKENKRTATFALGRWRTTSTAMTTPFLAGLVWPYLEVVRRQRRWTSCWFLWSVLASSSLLWRQAQYPLDSTHLGVSCQPSTCTSIPGYQLALHPPYA